MGTVGIQRTASGGRKREARLTAERPGYPSFKTVNAR
jgi:hypothetical protein